VRNRVPGRVLIHENKAEGPRVWVAVQDSSLKDDKVRSFQGNGQRRAAYTAEGVPIRRRLSQDRRFVHGYEILTADPVELGPVDGKLGSERRAGRLAAAGRVA